MNTDTFTGKDPFVSYIDTDICVHSQEEHAAMTVFPGMLIAVWRCYSSVYLYWLMCGLKL